MVLLATVLFGAFGVFADGVPIWMIPTVFVLGAGLIVVAYSIWGEETGDAGMVKRIVTQTGVLAAITYGTGWGFALPLVHLFAVADNVKYSGSRAVKPCLLAAFGWTLIGQLMMQAMLAPSIHQPLLDTWAIAAYMLLAVGAVASRIRQMTVAREEAEHLAKNSEELFRALVEDSSDVVLVVRDQKIIYQSPSVSRVLGYDVDEVKGTEYLGFMHPDDRDETVSRVLRMLEDGTPSALFEGRVRHADGSWVPVETSVRNQLDHPLVRGFVLNLRDMSERREFEAQLAHRAFHDDLTGLPNRALFQDRAAHAIARAERNGDPVAVLFIDVDNFKVVNDTLGHAVGDAALTEVATRIDACVRNSDTAARLGGDEFAVLLEDFRGEESPARMAQRILAELAGECEVEGHVLDLSASVGIARLQPGWTTDELIRNADIAMYMAKSSGKARYELFDADMHRAVVERLEMERDLSQALDRDEFVLHYQPIVSLEDRRIVGLEALLRWEHGQRGLVSPGHFIPVAEETGAILPIGRWVLFEAMRQTVVWQGRQPAGQKPLHISINVSMKQLAHGDLVADVQAALSETGIDPATVVLELTESALVDDTERTTVILTELKRLGVRLAIDDFGTGYSSLSYLQRFPLDILKIDRSFVEGVVRGTQSPALVRAIVEMSRSLELETVAEGIERDEELERVRAMHCELGQGFLFARPAEARVIDLQLGGVLPVQPALN